jgi:hypothetical protein
MPRPTASAHYSTLAPNTLDIIRRQVLRGTYPEVETGYEYRNPISAMAWALRNGGYKTPNNEQVYEVMRGLGWVVTHMIHPGSNAPTIVFVSPLPDTID